jgi:hypothetical protein
VNDNTAGTNTVAGFDRHRDGTLAPIDGSPFVAGGRGTGTIIGTQGALLAGEYRRSLSPTWWGSPSAGREGVTQPSITITSVGDKRV